MDDVAVRIVKTETKCKLCRSPHRVKIDELLLQRSQRKVNFEHVKQRLEEWGVPNVTRENLTIHFRKHSEIVSAQKVDERQAEIEATFADLFGDGATQVDVDGVLKAIFKLGATDFFQGLKDGTVKVSLDQMRQIADTLQKRKQADAQSELLRELGSGLGEVFGAMAEGVRQKELPAPAPELEGVIVAEFREEPG